MRSTPNLCIVGAAAAVALALAGPAHAALIIGGDVPIVPNLIVLVDVDGVALSVHDDGFGNSASDHGFVPTTPPAVDLSQSFSSAEGTSSSTVGFLLSGGGSSISIVSDPTTISLSQEDLSANPNDPALLQVVLAIPFTYESPNPTETVSFNMSFDVNSNLGALTGTDGLTVRSCVLQEGPLVTGYFSGFATNCTNQGGTPTTHLSVSNTSLPSSETVAFNETVVTDTPYLASLALDFQITNDTGPSTISIDDFVLSVGEVPVPGTALLGVAALALGIVLRRRG